VEGAKSHTGVIGLSAGTGLNLSEKKLDGAQRAEPAALREAFQKAADGLTFGYAFNGLPCGVTVEVSKAQPRLTERSEYLMAVERGIATLQCKAFIGVEHVGVTSLTFAIPDGLSVSAVKADNASAWKVESGLLTVTFVKPVIGLVLMDISGETSIAGEALAVPRIRLKGAQESESFVAFCAAGDVMLDATEAGDLRQVSTANIPVWMGPKGPKLAYSTAAPEWKLAVRVRPAAPEVRASVNAIFTFFTDRVTQEVFATFNVTRTEAFSFELSVPAGWNLVDVTGKQLKEWALDETTGIVRINPAMAVVGRFDIRLVIERGFSKNDASVELCGIVQRSVLDTTGSVRFCSGEDVEVNALSTDGLQVLSTDKLRALPESSGKTRFAYSITKAEWRAAVSVKQVQPEFDANTVSFVRARQGQLTVWTVLEMETTGIGSNRFVLKLPKLAANSDVKGEDIMSAELRDGTWEIILNNRHRGTYALSLSYEQLMDDKAGTAAFREVEVVGARRQSGFIAIGQEKTNVEIAVLEARGASPVGGSGMPRKYSDGLSFPATSFYRYSEGSAEISLKLTTHDIDPVLAARVRSCEMFSVLKDTGEIVTYMTCIVENAGRKQFLSVKLPKSASVLGAYLWGNPLKPNVADDGTIMLPITAAAGAKCTYDVGLVWSDASGKLGLGKELPLQAPQMDVKVDALTWDVFLPDNYGILRQTGNLKLTEAPAVDASSSLYANMGTSLSRSAETLWHTMPPAMRMFIYFLLASVLLCGIIYPVMKLLGILFGRMRDVYLSPKVVVVALLLVAVTVGFLLLPALSSARKSSPEGHAIASRQTNYSVTNESDDSSMGINSRERTRLYQKQLDEENNQLAEEKNYLVGQKKRLTRYNGIAADQSVANSDTPMQPRAPSPQDEVESAVNDRIAALEEQINVNKAMKENAKDARDFAKAKGENPENEVFNTPLTEEGFNNVLGVGGRAGGPAGKPQPMQIREKLPAVVNLLTQSTPTEGGVFNQYSRSDKGRSRGAMPITLTFPTENTLKWRYANPSLAGGGASLKLTCVSSRASMAVQSLVALLTLAGLFAFGMKNMRNAMIASGLLFTALFIAGAASDIAKNGIVMTVMWSALVALAGLGACLLVQVVKNREAAVAANSR
jgi:hypothetical protein